MKTRQKNAAENQPVTIDGTTGKPDPTPPKIDLKTADDVRLEMAKVYREMRGNRMDMGDGTKLVYVLGQIGKLVELHEIEQRIVALEASNDND